MFSRVSLLFIGFSELLKKLSFTVFGRVTLGIIGISLVSLLRNQLLSDFIYVCLHGDPKFASYVKEPSQRLNASR